MISTTSPRRGFIASTVATTAALLVERLLGATAEGGQSAPQTKTDVSGSGRRIVTGLDAQGRSRIEVDQPLAMATADGRPHRSDFWLVRGLPLPLNGPIEPTADWSAGTQAPAGGAFAAVFSWPAGYSYPRHMTPTLDFIVVISGHLELILDTESKILRPGDVLIQRGTAHAWRVPGPEPCTFAGIGLDAAARR